MTRFDRRFRSAFLVGLLLTVARAGAAGAQARAIDGPPRPVPPEVITRRADGQATVRAIKLAAPLRLDGVLDEEVYSLAEPAIELNRLTDADGKPKPASRASLRRSVKRFCRLSH